jgi:hypothetical protein
MGRREVNDQRDEPLGPATPGCPAMLIDAHDPNPGQPIRASCSDQVSGCPHRDGADSRRRHRDLGGNRRDGGAVNHQPPQYIPGTAPRRRRSRGRQLAEALVEYRTPALWRCAAVAGHGHPQHQWVAGNWQIGQRPDHGVAVAAPSRPHSGHLPSRATGLQKIVVCLSSAAASVIITPNSMVRMIVSVTTDGGGQ